MATKDTNNEYGLLLFKCKQIMRNLSKFEVRFIRRQAHHVAHCLTRASRSYASPKVFNYIPNCIMSSYLNEMLWFSVGKKTHSIKSLHVLLLEKRYIGLCTPISIFHICFLFTTYTHLHKIKLPKWLLSSQIT